MRKFWVRNCNEESQKNEKNQTEGWKKQLEKNEEERIKITWRLQRKVKHAIMMENMEQEKSKIDDDDRKWTMLYYKIRRMKIISPSSSEKGKRRGQQFCQLVSGKRSFRRKNPTVLHLQ